MMASNRRLHAFGAILGTLVLAACGASASAPSQSAQAAKPSAAASGSAATSSGPAASDWETQWNSWVAAANQEGTLSLSGNPSAVMREALTSFSKDYPKIQVEYTGLYSAELYPKQYAERAAGQYLWDVRVGGGGPQDYDAVSKGVIDPVRSVLLLPEVVDQSKWLGGIEGMFDDTSTKQYFFSFQAYLAFGMYVNRDVIPESQFNFAKDLLDPKWKGKISLQDPRQSAGNAHMSVLLKRFGEDFVRELIAKQQPAVTKDARQQVEWVIRNNYPIGISVDETEVHSIERQGLAFNAKPVLDAASLSTGAGGVSLVNRGPHPNAAKVFVNWLLSRNTQARVSDITKSNSRRLDVPPVDVVGAADPARINEYLQFANQREDFLPYKQRMIQIANELIK